MGSCGPVAWVLGSEPPAFSIGYADPMGEWDSGFTVLFDDAPDPEQLEEIDDDGRSSSACTACSTTTRKSAVASTSLVSTASPIWTKAASGWWAI